MAHKNKNFYPSLQLEWVKEFDIKRGTYVKVLSEFPSYTNGWDNTWVREMNAAISQIYPIIGITDSGICLKVNGSTWEFPFFILEADPEPERILIGDYEVSFLPEEKGYIKVGCQVVTIKEIKTIIEKLKELGKL